MADRGSAIQDILVKLNFVLNIPPFKGSSSVMSLEDGKKTQWIASVRIHVERAKGRVKQRFHTFDRDDPLSILGLSIKLGLFAAY